MCWRFPCFLLNLARDAILQAAFGEVAISTKSAIDRRARSEGEAGGGSRRTAMDHAVVRRCSSPGRGRTDIQHLRRMRPSCKMHHCSSGAK